MKTQQEETEATEKGKLTWWQLLFIVFNCWLVVNVLVAGVYISTQQPKVWFDRQWAGLALCKGGYRSWTLTFCDGFTIAPGSYTNGIAKMVPVTIDERKGTMRYGYHWPRYNHSDIRNFLEGTPGNYRVKSNVFVSSGLNWGTNLTASGSSNIVLTVTNTGDVHLKFTESDVAIFTTNSSFSKDMTTGHLWEWNGKKWLEYAPVPKTNLSAAGYEKAIQMSPGNVSDFPQDIFRSDPP